VEAGLVFPDTETESGTPVFGGTLSGMAPEGLAERTVDVNDTSANAAFLAWHEMLATAMSTQLPSLSPETRTLLTTIHSTDVETIQQALIQMANLSSLGLSPTQETLIVSKLGVLATAMAGANSSGGAFVLGMTVPGLMLPVMMETLDMGSDTTLSAETKGLLSTALYSICNGIAKANFENATSTKIPSKEFLNLISGDQQKVGTVLSSIANTMTLPPGVSGTDLTRSLDAITTSLCFLGAEGLETLQSVDSQGLIALFTQLRRQQGPSPQKSKPTS
jgi:hypothetical protein